MRDAMARFVPDGASVCLGTALEALIPFAAGHELIRQRRRDLTLVGPISDMLFDQLIGAGCVRTHPGRVGRQRERRASATTTGARWSSGVPGAIEVEDHSNLTIAVALQAAALGAPYIRRARCSAPISSQSNPTFSTGADPWSGEPVVLIPALAPDVAILHVQRADEEGHAHCWGTLGVTREAALAARRVIIVAEEIWPREPDALATRTGAGARAQGGRRRPRAVRRLSVTRPGPLPARPRLLPPLSRGVAHRRGLARVARRLSVLGVADWPAFLVKVGSERLDALRVKRHLLSEPLDYGA